MVVRLVVLGVVCLAMMGCGFLFEPDTIKYEVTGTASSVSVTMSNEGGNTEQLSDVSVPWSRELRFYIEDRGFFARISARNNGNSGRVTVNIYHNGRKLGTATSEGAYVTASASEFIECYRCKWE